MLNDFLVAGAPGSSQSATGLLSLRHSLQWLGFPVVHEKVEGPSSRITFLGIEFDTEALVLHLPVEKLMESDFFVEWAPMVFLIRITVSSFTIPVAPRKVILAAFFF